MFRVAASIAVFLTIGAEQPDPSRVAETSPRVPKNREPTSDLVARVSAGESEGETQRTPETTKKTHRNLPPNWREQFAAVQDQTPPKIDRVTPHPGGWIVDDDGVDQVQIRFIESVSVPAGAISAWKLVGGTVSNFTTSYDGGTNTLTVNFASPIRDNRLTLVVDYAVTDVAGNQLDGEINNPSNPTLPSGDGYRGGQAVFRFNILQGDANRDGIVNAADGALIQPLLGICVDEPGFNPLADLDLDGCVNTIDAGIYRLGVGHTLPATDGTPPFLTTILEPENNSLLRDLFTLRLVFNETMLPSRINTRTCYVVDQNGNVIVPQLVALGGFGDIIVYTFNPPLPQCGSYRLGISNSLADFSGELLSVPAPAPVISGFVPSPAPTLNAHTTSTRDPTITITGTAPAAEAVEVSGPMGVFTVPVTNPTLGSFTVDFTQHPLVDNRVNAIFVTGLSRCDGIRSPPTRTAITRDNQPPTLFIDFPTDGASITTNAADVAGRVGDVLSGYQGLAVTVNGTPAVVNEGIGTNGTFFAANISLNPSQANTIQVTATDQLGNSIVKQITVTQAPVPSSTRRMERFSGNGQSSPIHTVLLDPIVVQVFQENGTTPLSGKWVTFEVTRSNGRLGPTEPSVTPTPTDSDPGSMKFQAQTDAQGKAQAYWRLGDDAGMGNNRVRVTATEIAGTVEFCATAEAGPIKQINVGMGNSQIVEVGAPALEPLIAWVNDACNGNCPVQVTFTVTEGGGILTGNTSPLPCNDEDPTPPSVFTGQSVTVYTSRTGHAEVRFKAGLNPGNNRITASVAGLTTPATFIVFGVRRDPSKPTSFTGLVVDNGTQPIQGARCDLTINGVSVETVYTDLNGQFRFDNIPDGMSGAAGLTVDGFPATHIGGYPGVDVVPQSYPSLHYETVVIPNAENSLPTPVRLPKMDECNRAYYSQAVDSILTIRRRNPAVTDPNDPDYCLPAIDGLRFIVKAGSMSIFGQPAPEGSLLMLNQVHHDDIPMPLPDGAAPPMTGTLWPPYAKFDPPVAVEFPNMVGLPPGAIAYFLSFDHDTSRFEIVASGHVTDDGSLIVTDPGVGIPHGGWHGNCPPYSVTGDCDRCEGDDNCCNDRCCEGSDCCESPDPCCDAGDPCCHNPNRCCNPDNPCCGSPDPCCNPNDECCGNPDRCCNPDNPCCGSTDPCCNHNDPCCPSGHACCNPDNPCCIAAAATRTNAAPIVAVTGPSKPCCEPDPDPCCNVPDPCCGVDCNDGNSCTQDICDENGECQNPCLPDCGGCGQNKVCFDCGCVSGNCSFQVIEEDSCPGGTVEMELLGSCNPDCGPMTFSMVKSVQYLDVTLPGSIPCDGTVHQETVTVRIDEDAPPDVYSFRILGMTPLAQCEYIVNFNVVECVDLSYDGVADEDETDPGGFLCVNDDDDDDNDTPDKDDAGPTLNENDLKPLVLSLNPGWSQAGVVLLQCRVGCDKLRFYEGPDRSNPFTLPIQWSVPHPDLPKTLYVEGIKKSTALRDVEIEARFNGGGTECKDVVRLTVVQVDLDVDSDNTNPAVDFGPQRNQGEDDIEDKDDLSGRIVWVNNNDDDRDNVADFGDGYNLDAANPNDDANADEEGFVRMVFEVPPTVDLTLAQVRITYPASDPAGATVITTPPNIAPAAGNLRIWTENGNSARNSGVIPSGDFVPGGGTYAASALGLSNAMRIVNLWLEGIRPSAMIGDQRILFEIDPDGPNGPADFCGDAVRVTVSQLEILAWDSATTSMTLADHVNVGHWGDDRGTNELNGYTAGLSGTALNGAGSTFIDVDPDRFMVRVTHLPGNANPAVAESIVAQVGTLTDTGGGDDADHNITLLETGPSFGVFESETQLLTAPDLSMVAATDQDDGLAVYSQRTAATVADEGDNDRTHKVTIDGHVRATYNAPSGPCDLSVPACDRIPTDQRKEVRIRMHVFNEPFDDFGLDRTAGTGDAGEGNGVFDFQDVGADGTPGTGDTGEGDGVWTPGEPSEFFRDISGDGLFNTVLGSTASATSRVSEEIQRSNIAWLQGCIRIVQVGGIIFADAPNTPAGRNILIDGDFDDGPGADEEIVLTSTSGATCDIVEVFFVSPFTPVAMAEGLASTPNLRGGIVLPAALNENTYLFVASSANIRRRVLAHELGHALTNQGDVTTPDYIFFHSLNTSDLDDDVNLQRRITRQTEINARTCRAAGAFGAVGNRMISGCP